MIALVVLVITLSWMLPSQVTATEVTIVQVDPSNLTKSPGETFTIDISCTSFQPIKSFELQIMFNPSLLQATSVVEGTIFTGYTTFFNAGTIDNQHGTIIDIYDLIMGHQTVTAPGTFITISFTARNNDGTSEISLNNVGVTNTTEYIPITVANGTITISGGNHPPSFSSITPSNHSTNIPRTTSSLSLTIQDTEGDLFNWSIITNPNIGSSNGVNDHNGSKVCTITGLSYSTTYYWTVSCIDTGSNQWINQTYWFTTSAPPGGGGGGGSGGDDGQPPEETNTPPVTPSKPSGPLYVELGFVYYYSSLTSDPDGDQIRLRFDWGDDTMSNWSSFVSSNTSVTLSHQWTSIAVYNVRVMAQDENGSNSSWSAPLVVTVSQINDEGEPPTLDILLSDNQVVNQTIQFDASNSFDSKGVLISYSWDFGDGETDTGKIVSHSYTDPGTYSVTLTVIDNNGKTYTKNIMVTIEAESSNEGNEAQKNFFSFPFSLNIIIGAGALIVCIGIIVFFRDRIRMFVFHRNITHKEKVIKQLDTEIAELSKTMPKEPSLRKTPSTKEKTYFLSEDLNGEKVEDKVDNLLVKKLKKQ